SRRRHTRWPRDWSSDVCSSDLSVPVACQRLRGNARDIACVDKASCPIPPWQINRAIAWRKVGDEILHERIRPQKSECHARFTNRSEERRVGKEFKSSNAQVL